MEQQLEGGRHQRSALRILAFPGPRPEPYVRSWGSAWSCYRVPGSMPHPSPMGGSLGRAPHPTILTPGTPGALPWVVEQLLEGNSLTFLLLGVTLPGSSGTAPRCPP